MQHLRPSGYTIVFGCEKMFLNQDCKVCICNHSLLSKLKKGNDLVKIPSLLVSASMTKEPNNGHKGNYLDEFFSFAACDQLSRQGLALLSSESLGCDAWRVIAFLLDYWLSIQEKRIMNMVCGKKEVPRSTHIRTIQRLLQRQRILCCGCS